jgi:hypothetical protein
LGFSLLEVFPMRFYSLSVLFLAIASSVGFAGDCADGACAAGAGRRGLFGRRAERRSYASCQAAAATATVVEESPAVIRTESTFKTVPTGKKTVIVPAEGSKGRATQAPIIIVK